VQLGVVSIQGGAGMLVDGIREVIDKYHKDEWALSYPGVHEK